MLAVLQYGAQLSCPAVAGAFLGIVPLVVSQGSPMQRSALPLLRQLQRAGAVEAATDAASTRAFSAGAFSFSSTLDAPTSALSGSVSLNVKQGKGPKGVEVSVKVGSASASAKYSPADLRKLAAKKLTLAEVARVSVLHSSLMDYLLRLSHERYSVLANWPDFTKVYGKDYYYRAHPEDLKKFYELVDEFHRMYDVVTEFDSLSGLASQLVPGYRKRRQNVVHPALGPTVADAAVTQFLLAHAK